MSFYGCKKHRSFDEAHGRNQNNEKKKTFSSLVRHSLTKCRRDDFFLLLNSIGRIFFPLS
jgi:hypothetical protein